MRCRNKIYLFSGLIGFSAITLADETTAKGVIVTPPPQCSIVPPPSAQAFDLRVPEFNTTPSFQPSSIFEWDAVDGENVHYQLRISANSTFTNIILDSEVDSEISMLDSVASAIVTPGLSAGPYYWQVTTNTGAVSKISCFLSPGSFIGLSNNISITGTIFEAIDNRLTIIAALADVNIEARDSNSNPIGISPSDSAYLPSSGFLCQDSPAPGGGQPVKLCSNADGRYFVYFQRPDANTVNLPNSCTPATNNGRILAAKNSAGGQRGLCLTDNTPSVIESFNVTIEAGNTIFEDEFE
jgi:hypothetical protein